MSDFTLINLSKTSLSKCLRVSATGASLAILLGGCAVVDRMAEPFMSLLTGEELAVVSTDPLYTAPVEEETIAEQFVTDYGEPLAIIRYDAPPQSYDQALGMAISRTLAVRPFASFEIVALAPPAPPGMSSLEHTDTAVENATAVMENLVRHGVAPANIDMTTITNTAIAEPGEIHIYVQ